ncbi:SDR family NAD(P)-dependent oxidoreductase [Umezawaea tangerina]|uniref:NAD(P)-dependent dehydrogenase (Short-subunit alcohol dehydrogenase family) n=1 Tax=Umezawaea tangerina TaxID=84725 RepID=A0A2T0SZZ7_9PSEU|nr:SDR family NAD(P)-dependent oxidoreductase [Umezawaea tangerina]PRY38995.1 NAD(P)-dependent dehydrogenase (short-subunit alcohol dehydrogenase family) [Umezawaea tangerina]
MTDRLKDKVALITGTGSGIGRAAALLFASEGATIVGCDINAERDKETVALVERSGGRMHSTAPLDLAEPDQVAAWVQDAIARFGHIDVLYNNAGFSPASTFEAQTPESWRSAMRNEVDVVYYPTHAVWPHMKAGGGGSIISTSSITADQTNGTHLSAHGIGKGAIASFAPHLAVEGGPLGIRVNTISPGLTRTNQTDRFITDKDTDRTPLGRVGTPEDVALVALFLACDDSRFVTGANIVVDGGQHVLMPANR